MSHVFAKQQESQCKASGRTVGDSFYRDSGGELKREALYFTYYKAYSESDHSECRMILQQLLPTFLAPGIGFIKDTIFPRTGGWEGGWHGGGRLQ